MAMLLCLGAGAFGFDAFFAGAVTGALPGIAVQIVLIPVLVILTEHLNFLDLRD